MKKYAKKHVLIFILIAFAITIILWPLATKQPIHTIHENPEIAQTSFAVSITKVLDYTDIADVLASGGYKEISDLISEIDLDTDDLPAEIQFIMHTYNDLLSDITTRLSNLDATLDEAVLLLDQSEFEETSLKITDAEYFVEDIEASLEDMDSANQQIKNILGDFTPTKQLEVVNELRVGLTNDKEKLETLRAAYEASAPQKIPTGLILEVPGQVYLGLSYQISGQITYDAGTPSIKRDIRLLWDNEPIDNFYSSQDSFIRMVPLDENTALGNHTLKVIIEAKDQYGSTSENRTLTVIKDLPEVKIDDLSYEFLSRQVLVEGKLNYSMTSLQEATVIIELKGISTSVRTIDGGFKASLGLPLSLINIGKQEIKISVESSEVWQSSTNITAEIFILDIFSLGFISTAFIAVGMIIYVARRGGPGKGESRILEMPASSEPTQEYTDVSRWEFEEQDLTGTRGQIFKAYNETMKMVENFTGIYMEPHMTLREFLKETMPKLKGAVQAFTELTCQTENALYSLHMPGLGEAKKAESLVQTVKEALKS